MGMLITVSGLDGAGKSTLIESLRATLEQQHRRVAVLHLDTQVGVYAYVRMLRDALAGLVQRPKGTTAVVVERSNGRSRTVARRMRDAIVWSSLIRRLIYPVDLVVFLCYRAYLEGVRRRVLIMDRYFYDTLVDVSDGHRWAWIRLLKLMTPTPTLPVLVDVGPEEAYARKGEYSVQYLRDRWRAYQRVFPWVRGSVRLHNQDLTAAGAALHLAVLERLGVQ